MKPESAWFDDKSVMRVAAIVVVVVVHSMAFVFISLPTTPLRRVRAGKVSGARSDLVVHLVDVHVPAENRAGAARVKQPPVRKPAPRRITPRTRHAAAKVAPDREAHRHRKRASRPLDLSLPDMSRGKPVVGRTLGHARPGLHLRLPGGGHVHGAPRIQLADPRTQGVAGVLRMIQRHLLGAVNSHCVEVDSWRGMSREERLEQHVTQADIQHVAERYGCLPPERHQAPAGVPGPPWVPQGH